ncbi:MAG: NAD(P)/FAD-dependent oxidoreductase, partial [Rhodococcus sp. (in: high G+C Gram-positive bacteria)]
MSLSVTDTSERVTAPRQVDTIIIGSGFAGLGAAIKLTQKGKNNFLVLERGSDVGGTWRDNTYPGAACDVPSHLYSYSFALNPDWTRSFSTQPEIQKYISSVARKYNVLGKHVFNSDVTSVIWDENTHRWNIVASTGEYTAKVVVT